MEYRVGYLKDWSRDLDPGGGKIITEMHGYIPVQKRIENIMEAGGRLVEHRTAEAYYHFRTGEEYDLSFDDPTQRKGYDPADATQDNYANKARLKASQSLLDQQRAEQKAEADLKAAEAEKSLKPPQ